MRLSCASIIDGQRIASSRIDPPQPPQCIEPSHPARMFRRPRAADATRITRNHHAIDRTVASRMQHRCKAPLLRIPREFAADQACHLLRRNHALMQRDKPRP